ncbi:MAG: hypothetical protein RLZZ416_760 [Candidatus Parcubacteria bacterium]|jgi:uncharacterized membrane protein
MTFSTQSERRVHQIFEISILLKGANALVELILGLVLLVSTQLNDLLLALVQNELVEDPGDFLARHAEQFARYLTPEFQLYSALYLLSHGIVKMVLVWGLLRDKLWAYPASIAVLALFILYQVIKIVQNHSIPLIVLTLFDLLVMWLIWHEYRLLQRKNP